MENSIRKFFSQYKLSTMFSIVIFIVAMIVSTVVQSIKYNESKNSLEQNLHSKAVSILDFADVLLKSRNEKFFSGQSSEVPQIIQNEIFDKFSAISDGKVLFKEASKMPVDPKNKAFPFEEEMINYFQKNPDKKDSVQNVSHDGKEFYMYSRPIVSEQKCQQCHPQWVNPGEVIAIEDTLIDLSDFNSALNRSLLLSVVLWFINIFILLTVIHVLFKKLVSNRTSNALEVILRVEKGNFLISDLVKDENVKQKNSKNEIDKIFTHLIRMVNSLKPVIDNVVQQSKNVVFESIYGYAKIQENTKLSKVQSEVVAYSTDNIQHILDINNNLDHNLNHLLEKTENSTHTIEDGKAIVKHNFTSSQLAAQAMSETVVSIQELKQYSNDISHTIDKITDIANETNLISLNAAIEASRAGKHGKGFAVVADKIRQLADVSLENASAISKILQAIHKNIDKASLEADNTNKTIDKLKESSQVLQQNFESINDAINENNQVLNAFRDNFKEEKQALNVVSENLSDMNRSNESLSHNASDVEVAISEITHMSGELEYLADGFELIHGRRKSKREIVTPAVQGYLLLSRNQKLEVFLFDISDQGLSVIITEKYKDIQIYENENAKLVLGKEVRGKKEFDIHIVHVHIKKENGTRQIGATI